MTTTPKTVEDKYEELVLAIGSGFHPDTFGAEYASLPPGLTPEYVDTVVEEAMACIEDPYSFALAVLTCDACRSTDCRGECLY